jgi:hypothetical protein
MFSPPLGLLPGGVLIFLTFIESTGKIKACRKANPSTEEIMAQSGTMICPKCKKSSYGIYCQKCRHCMVRDPEHLTEEEKVTLEFEQEIPWEERGKNYLDACKILGQRAGGDIALAKTSSRAVGSSKMPERYPALRTIAAVYKTIAALVVVLIVLLVLFFLRAGFVAFIGSAVVGGIIAYIFWVMITSFAELILVQIDIEANTRRTAELLSRQEK